MNSFGELQYKNFGKFWIDKNIQIT